MKQILVYCATSLVLLPYFLTSYASDPLPNELFSRLTNGKFDRQLEMPATDPLSSGDILEPKMIETYAQLPFDIGERMRYAITYIGIKGGTAELAVRQPVKWKNSTTGWAHRFTGEVKSADWVRWIVTTHEAIESLTDPSPDLIPLRFYINQIENKFYQSKIVSFFQSEKKIIQRTKRKDRDEVSEEFPFDKAQDAVGSLYYVRQQLAAGTIEKSFSFPVFTSEKTWQLTGDFVKREKIKVEGHEFDTDLFDLKTHFGSKLEQKGKIKVWLTHDMRALPVLIEAHVLFGSVKLSLTDWEQGAANGGRKRLFEPILAK